MLDNMRQYLSALSIPAEQKRYAMNFCKKMSYLNELRDAAIQDVQDYICTGYGNVNSNICFIFKDKQCYDVVHALLQEMLEKFHINPWDVYVTFVDKSQKEYNKKYAYLANEIHAINPGLLYVFDTNESMYQEIINAFQMRNIALPEKHFTVDVQKLASTDTDVRHELWNILKYLINYKETEQEG